MTVVLLVAATLFFLLTSGFYSGSEMGLYCVNRIRLRLRSERERATAARQLHTLIQDRQETVLAILLATNLANYLLTVAASAWLARAFSLDAETVTYATAALLSPAVFVLGDVVPKNWFQADADHLMYRSARVLRTTVIAFRWTGLLWLLQLMTRWSTRLAGDEERGARGEVLGLMREGAAFGAMSTLR